MNGGGFLGSCAWANNFKKMGNSQLIPYWGWSIDGSNADFLFLIIVFLDKQFENFLIIKIFEKSEYCNFSFFVYTYLRNNKDNF